MKTAKKSGQANKPQQKRSWTARDAKPGAEKKKKPGSPIGCGRSLTMTGSVRVSFVAPSVHMSAVNIWSQFRTILEVAAVQV